MTGSSFHSPTSASGEEPAPLWGRVGVTNLTRLADEGASAERILDEAARYLSDIPEAGGAPRAVALTREVIAVVAHKMAEEQTTSLRARVELYNRAQQTLETASEPDTLLQSAVLTAIAAGFADACVISLIRESRDALSHLHRHTVAVDKRLPHEHRISEALRDGSLDSCAAHGTGFVLRSGVPDLIPDVAEHHLGAITSTRDQYELLKEAAPTSYMCVPLGGFHADSPPVGAMAFLSCRAQLRYDYDDLTSASWLASWCEPVLSATLAPGEGKVLKPPHSSVDCVLTARHRQILSLVRDGLSNAQIAASLYVGEGTIKNHLKGSFRRLGVRGRLEAVRAAERLGELPAP